MDRIEAYTLLTEEMKSLAQTVRRSPADLSSGPVEVDVWGATGVLYHVALMVEPISRGRFAVSGTVHDNSAYRLSLLEERLEFDLHGTS